VEFNEFCEINPVLSSRKEHIDVAICQLEVRRQWKVAKWLGSCNHIFGINASSVERKNRVHATNWSGNGVAVEHSAQSDQLIIPSKGIFHLSP